ncbi:hypothetical protein JCM6882_004621 [Rhodosporidiobolus microsporus]
MPPTLPLELQLEILEHALPPVTLRPSPQRRDYLISLALVHRSWTKTALKGFAKCEVFDLYIDDEYEARIMAWKRKNSVRKVRAFELRLDGKQSYPGQLYQRAQNVGVIKLDGEGVEQLSVQANWSWWRFPFERVFPDLRRFVWASPSMWRPGAGDKLENLPRTLSFLSVSSFSWDSYDPHYSTHPFTSLRTLLLANMDLSELPINLFLLFPNLRILAWSDNQPTSPSTFLSHTTDIPIRHLLLKGVMGGLVGVVSSLSTPPASLTIVNPPSAIAGLESWCEEEGVELRYAFEGGYQGVFDLEMWAFLRD